MALIQQLVDLTSRGGCLHLRGRTGQLWLLRTEAVLLMELVTQGAKICAIYVTISVVATEILFTKALPSFPCFMFLLYLEYCGVVPQNVYIFD